MGAYQKRAYLRRKAQLKAEYDAKVAEKSEKLRKMIADNTPLNDFDMAGFARTGRVAPTNP
jgi:hypothetical protein